MINNPVNLYSQIIFTPRKILYIAHTTYRNHTRLSELLNSKNQLLRYDYDPSAEEIFDAQTKIIQVQVHKNVSSAPQVQNKVGSIPNFLNI